MDIQPSENALRLTALVAENVGEPTIIYDDSAALCIAIVERAGAGLITLGWDVPGLYILLEPISTDGTWGCYVGKAPAGLRSRLQSHVKQKDHWSRAILISRQTHDGFNSAQVGWLESRFYDLLDSATFADSHNANRPSDETVPTYERATLENCVLPVTRVLRLLGYDPSAPGDEPAVSPKGKHNYYGVKLAQLVASGVVRAGSQLVSINSGWPTASTVSEDGSVTVGSKVFGTPSAAATEVTGGPVNGWEFWALQEGDERVPLSGLRKRYIDQGAGEGR